MKVRLGTVKCRFSAAWFGSCFKTHDLRISRIFLISIRLLYPLFLQGCGGAGVCLQPSLFVLFFKFYEPTSLKKTDYCVPSHDFFLLTVPKMAEILNQV